MSLLGLDDLVEVKETTVEDLPAGFGVGLVVGAVVEQNLSVLNVLSHLSLFFFYCLFSSFHPTPLTICSPRGSAPHFLGFHLCLSSVIQAV